MRDYPTPSAEEAVLLAHAQITGDELPRPVLDGKRLQDAVNILFEHVLPPGFALDYDVLDGTLWFHAPCGLSLRFYSSVLHSPTEESAVTVEIRDRRGDPLIEQIWPGDPDTNY
jgi:hypothetical protein